MKRNTYNIHFELRGKTYYDLLQYALGVCPYFLLVPHPTLDETFTAGEKKALVKFEPFLVSKEITNQWPGNVMGMGYTATVFTFRFTTDSLKIIKDLTKRLYDWNSPRLPEDLCLVREDYSPWLVTITHEKDAYLELSGGEYERLIQTLPGIVPFLSLYTEG